MNRAHIELYRYRTCVAMLRGHIRGSELLTEFMRRVCAEAVIGYRA